MQQLQPNLSQMEPNDLASQRIQDLFNIFDGKELRKLSREELVLLKQKAKLFLSLTVDDETAIDGFKSSYASALLHFHFPNLIPILDRRVLSGAGIKAEISKYGQVVNIEQYYPALIDKFFGYLRDNPGKSLREYDRECFIQSINK